MIATRPLRVLHLVTRRQLRGAEVFAAGLSGVLAAAGHEVVFAGLYTPGEPSLAAIGCRSLDLTTGPAGAPRPGAFSPRLTARLAGLMRRFRPDLVQANGSDTLKYALAAAALVRPRPRIVYRNISVASRWLRGPLHRRLHRILLRHVDHVVSVSAASAADLLERCALPPVRVTVIPRGVPLVEAPDPWAARRALAAASGCRPDAPIIVHVGSFTPEKDHRGLLDVLLAVRREVPGTQLVTFGDGPLRPAVEAAARSLGLDDAVSFAGARPDAADLAAGADLLVLFSRIEGLPGVVLEAGARGLPVVATGVGGVAEVVRDGIDGLLVEPSDIAAAAAAATRLLLDADLARRLGQSLRQRVCADFSLEAVAQRYLELYERLLTSS